MFRMAGIPVLAVLIALLDAAALAAEGKSDRLNVLMIAVDDLRPELGCYGASYVHSPNIDKLARAGMVFSRAYCQQAVCSPSRTSLLTGLRPDTTKIYDLNTHFRKTIPNAVTLPEYFKQHGYHTQGLSKIYHGGMDDPQSWSVPHWAPGAPIYSNPETVAQLQERRSQSQAEGKAGPPKVIEKDPKTGIALKITRTPQINGPSWEASDFSDSGLADGMTADRALEVLREIKDKPFFLAVGFLKPHLPFVAPKKYFDLYPLEKINLAGNPNPPEDVPPPAMHDSSELRSYSDIPKKGPIPNDKARHLIRAYRAATSYTDAQIGRVLDELDRLGLRDKTIVVLWGDHGWHLGEHGLWCKHTNFEEATRSLLIFSLPGQRTAGTTTAVLAEFVDIYPTLCELAGLPIPEGLEGTSLAPVLNAPDRPFKKAAFSQYPRLKLMGHSIRTDRYRYTEWAEPGQEPVGIELYDHQADPGENVNLAGKPEQKGVVKELAAKLHAGWREALPPGTSCHQPATQSAASSSK